jgi:response regulator of citrate/malate metabolism
MAVVPWDTVASTMSAPAERLEEALGAMRHAREQLLTTETAYRRAIKALDQGKHIGDVLDIIAAASTRSDLNSALGELEHSRHLARLAMFARGIDEGLSMSELGRKMGISRQLAARYAHEVSADTG